MNKLIIKSLQWEFPSMRKQQQVFNRKQGLLEAEQLS